VSPIERAVDHIRKEGFLAEPARHARHQAPSVRIVGGRCRAESGGLVDPFRIEETRTGWTIQTLYHKWSTHTLEEAVGLLLAELRRIKW
jgi:hypothetical protein